MTKETILALTVCLACGTMAFAADLSTKGHIGLQSKHGGAHIFFRNAKMKPLS